MTFLLDVNVLIALIDPLHVSHGRVHSWFHASGRRSWATSPITQNGVIRIVGSAQYPNSPKSLAAVITSIRSLLAQSGHTFWSDDVSLLDSRKIDTSRLLTSSQVSDSYLLALAKAHGGKLATFDRRLIPDAVVGGSAALFLIQ